MRIIYVHAVLNEQHPIPMHRQARPDIVGRGRLRIMQAFEQLLLRAIGNLKKRTAVLVASHHVDRLQPEPIRLPIRRHVLEPITIELVRVEPPVDAVHDRNPARLDPVVLREDVVAHDAE